MSVETPPRGTFVALVTPMQEDILDYPALEAHAEWLISEGVEGLVVCGSTGEAATMTTEEWQRCISLVVAKAAKRVPVYAGAGSNCTSATIERVRAAKHCGADGVMLVTPYYNKPSQEGLIAHYTAIANAVPDIPIMLYNVPGRTGCDLLPETVARLSKVPSIKSCKDASGKMERYAQIRAQCDSDFRVYCGEDDQAVQAIVESDIDGLISVSGNVFPGPVSKAVRAALSKNKAEAEALDKILQNVHKVMFCETNPVAVKFALSQVLKRIPAGIRLPLLPLSEDKHELVRRGVEEATAQLS